MSRVTELLNQISAGDRLASQDLLPIVYDELRRLAQWRLQQEQPGHTLQATALVHEAYLRLVGAEGERKWDSVGHFYAAAAEAMRRIMVDHARKKKVTGVAVAPAGRIWMRWNRSRPRVMSVIFCPSMRYLNALSGLIRSRQISSSCGILPG